jgi:hypothetical protein
MLMMW